MAGGHGTRFWPESTKEHPKQYLKLTGDLSLLQKTWRRLDGVIPFENRYLVTIQEQKNLAQLHSMNHLLQENILFEPSSRNTAACLLLALAAMENQYEDLKNSVLVLLPADHVILNEEAFKNSLNEAITSAAQYQKIITLGIRPYFPHTGYGYIKKSLQGPIADNLFEVERFVEKPDFIKAQQYLTEGSYFWNSGMFVAPLAVWLEELKIHAPELMKHYAPFKELIKKKEDRKLAALYQKLPSISLDYALMEKSKEIYLQEASFDWNDLGSWDALESVCDKIDNNVMVSSNSRYYFKESKGNIISTEDGKFVGLINVQDMIVISNDKCLLVLPKKDAQRIKDVVDFLKSSPGDYEDLL